MAAKRTLPNLAEGSSFDILTRSHHGKQRRVFDMVEGGNR